MLYPLKCHNRQRERRPDIIVRAPHLVAISLTLAPGTVSGA